MKPKNIIKIEEQIKQKEKELEALDIKLAKAKSNMSIKCVCGKMHKVKELDLVGPYRYHQSYSSYEDSEWLSDGLYFQCPINLYYNKINFPYLRGIPYEYEFRYVNNAAEQFSRNYKTLFKSYRSFNEGEDNSFTINKKYINNYIDQNREKFGLVLLNKYYDDEGKEHIV